MPTRSVDTIGVLSDAYHSSLSTRSIGTIVTDLSFLTLQRGNAVRDAPRHPATPSAGQWCSRVARNFTSGQRSSIRARFTRVGAR
ncbi:DUF1534 domain-containing protein [Pseudomonas syringae UB303]|uniref:DUF1534 domain-containing protein n=1 Tax=Pseudomonas syringae UB303 TaxID=1357287 RepID=A0AAJ4B977_PSESX|nr:DUF1534 domain-containing protein [Pseudomonas syringae UB303]